MLSLRSDSFQGRGRSRLRDGPFQERFPRHLVPGYNRRCPYGDALSAIRNRIKLALRLQNDFDASILFVAKGLISGGRFLQRKAVSDDKGGIDFASFDLFQ